MKKYIKVDIEDLHEDKESIHGYDIKIMESLRNSIKKRGQIETILVRDSGEGYDILDGKTRVRIMKDLGIKSVFCCSVGKITDEEAELITIEMAEIKFQIDVIKIAESFERIVKKYPVHQVAETVPWTEEEIEKFSTLLHFDQKQYEGWDEKKILALNKNVSSKKLF